MLSCLTDAAVWAQEESADAQLSDKRRTERLVKIATDLAIRPSGTMPAAIKDIKSAYTWAASGAAWNAKGAGVLPCHHRPIGLPHPHVRHRPQRLVPPPAFLWRHGAVGTAENLGIFLRALWALC